MASPAGPAGSLTVSDGDRSGRTRAEPPFGADVAVMPVRTWPAPIWVFGAAICKQLRSVPASWPRPGPGPSPAAPGRSAAQTCPFRPSRPPPAPMMPSRYIASAHTVKIYREPAPGASRGGPGRLLSVSPPEPPPSVRPRPRWGCRASGRSLAYQAPGTSGVGGSASYSVISPVPHGRARIRSARYSRSALWQGFARRIVVMLPGLVCAEDGP